MRNWCPSCNGAGRRLLTFWRKCRDCGGTGDAQPPKRDGPPQVSPPPPPTRAENVDHIRRLYEEAQARFRKEFPERAAAAENPKPGTLLGYPIVEKGD